MDGPGSGIVMGRYMEGKWHLSTIIFMLPSGNMNKITVLIACFMEIRSVPLVDDHLLSKSVRIVRWNDQSEWHESAEARNIGINFLIFCLTKCQNRMTLFVKVKS